MKCADIQNLLIETDDLSGLEKQPEIAAHLGSCPTCQAACQYERQLKTAFEAMSANRPPLALEKRILAIPQEHSASEPRASWFPFPLNFGLSFALVFLIGVGLVSFQTSLPLAEHQLKSTERAKSLRVEAPMEAKKADFRPSPPRPEASTMETTVAQAPQPVPGVELAKAPDKIHAEPVVQPFQIAAKPTPSQFAEETLARANKAPVADLALKEKASSAPTTTGGSTSKPMIAAAPLPPRPVLSMAAAPAPTFPADKANMETPKRQANQVPAPQETVRDGFMLARAETMTQKSKSLAGIAREQEEGKATANTGEVMLMTDEAANDDGQANSGAAGDSLPGKADFASSEMDKKEGFLADQRQDRDSAPSGSIAGRKSQGLDRRQALLEELVSRHQNEITAGIVNLELWARNGWITSSEEVILRPDQGKDWLIEKPSGHWTIRQIIAVPAK